MAAGVAEQTVERLVELRSTANAAFFASQATRIAELCARMARRFTEGGRLIAIACSPAAISDARHIAVEFVHPVIVGKRALPALALTDAAAADGLSKEIALLASARDMIVAFGARGESVHDAERLASAIASGRRLGCLTIAFDELGAEYEFGPPSADPFIRQELIETLYHVLWELVHVFFEHDPMSQPSASSDPGASAFLYPFLTTTTVDYEAIQRDVAGSVVAKSETIGQLRERAIGDAADSLMVAARAARERLEAGGLMLAFGNGGSATDAMDLVADLRWPPVAGLRPRRALDLTDDPAIITALANDVGMDVAFARQIIAYGRPGDVAVAFSTSGGSRNIIAALGEARRRGLLTIAFTGYDGGRIAAERLADWVINAPSEHVPRIQEAHATAYHILRTLVG